MFYPIIYRLIIIIHIKIIVEKSSNKNNPKAKL